MRLNWKAIIDLARKAAEDLGHKLEPFDKAKAGSLFRNSPHRLRMSRCSECGGCCWISWTTHNNYRAGGRILKYKCGTLEAAGVK